MSMPGFNADWAVPGRSGGTWSEPAIAVAGSGVVPAMPCCSACAEACATSPRGRFCQGCRHNPCNSSC
jgi:hypothetical protein